MHAYEQNILFSCNLPLLQPGANTLGATSVPARLIVEASGEGEWLQASDPARPDENARRGQLRHCDPSVAG